MDAIFRRRWRPALALASALLLPAALAAEPATGFASSYEADLRRLYDEATAIGAETFVIHLYISADEAAVRALDAQLGAAGPARGSLSALKPLPATQMRAYATPAPLREQLRRLRPGQTSRPFQPYKGHWALVELKAIDVASPMPPFAALRDSLMRLAGIGALPDPATLRGHSGTQARASADSGTAPDPLPADVDVNKLLASGYTLLQRALRQDQPEQVKTLLARGADPNRCPMDACPLQLALQSPGNALLFTTLLLEAGARPDQTAGLPGQERMLAQACQRGRLDIVTLLLEKGADANGDPQGRAPLEVALENGNLELMRLLLAKGANPDGRPQAASPLQRALTAGNRDMVQLLLDHGADALTPRPLPDSAQNLSPLQSALRGPDPEQAGLLRAAVLKQLGAKREHRWSAWIEQRVLAPPSKDPNAPLVHVVRTPLKAGSRIVLNREYFTLHVRLHPKATLRLEASTGTAPGEELKAGDLRAPLFDRRRSKSGNGKPLPLLVSDGKARAARPGSVGGIMALAPARRGFDRIDKSEDGPVHVLIVDRVRLDQGRGPVEVALEKSGLQEVDLVLGSGVDYGDTLADFVNAQRVTLVFK